MSRVLVIGYGNPLRGDDGLGWYAAQEISEQVWDQDVEVEIVAIHQLTPELAEPISRADLVLFIDARIGAEPGRLSVSSVTPDDPASDSAPCFGHHLTPASLMMWAVELFGRCPKAVAVAVVGKSFALGSALSDVVEDAKPRLLNCVTAIVAGLGQANMKGFPMHEFAIVESLIQETLSRLEQNQIKQGQVTGLRFQRGSTFSEDALRQAYEMLSPGTLLENAELIIETITVNFKCACGYAQTITSDDLIGHMFVCPACGAVREVDEAHDLTLMEVVLAANPTAQKVVSREAIV